MPEVTSHAQGAPSWAELDTTDDIGALAFYSAPLWLGRRPPGNGAKLVLPHAEDKTISPHAPSTSRARKNRRRTSRPHWNIYFTVASVDQTVETVKQNGGTVVFGPWDVFEAGRMAMCQDPQGAFFAIWQAKQHIGCRVKLEPGAMFWNELLTTDRNAAIDFYTATLGVGRGQVMQPDEYAMLQAGGEDVAGVMQITPDMGEFPPHWSVYFGVANADEAVAKAQSLGATVYVPPTDIVPVEGQPPIGRFAALGDPQGAAFSIFQPV